MSVWRLQGEIKKHECQDRKNGSGNTFQIKWWATGDSHHFKRKKKSKNDWNIGNNNNSQNLHMHTRQRTGLDSEIRSANFAISIGKEFLKA